MLVTAVVLLAIGASDGGHSLSETISLYCLDCHSGDSPKGQLDLDVLSERPSSAETKTLPAVRERLRRGDLPPAGKDLPDAPPYAALVSSINASIDERAGHAPPGRPTLRRLNRA